MTTEKGLSIGNKFLHFGWHYCVISKPIWNGSLSAHVSKSWTVIVSRQCKQDMYKMDRHQQLWCGGLGLDTTTWLEFSSPSSSSITPSVSADDWLRASSTSLPLHWLSMDSMARGLSFTCETGSVS